MSESTPPSTPVAKPPKRRFTMTIEVDADNTARMSEVLSQIDYELWSRPDSECDLVSGGGYRLRIVEHPDGLTGADYDAALDAWWEAKRASRRSASSAQERD